MKFIRKIVAWFYKKYQFYNSSKFSHELVGDLPEAIPELKILVVVEGRQPDSLVFKCPCGCQADIYLNLLMDASPRWRYRITKKGNISISPSVWRKSGCKSHFFVRESRIDWV